jgi:hypothetical protein
VIIAIRARIRANRSRHGPPEDRRSFSSVLSDFSKTLASGEVEVGVAQDQLTPAKRGHSAAKLLFVGFLTISVIVHSERTAPGETAGSTECSVRHSPRPKVDSPVKSLGHGTMELFLIRWWMKQLLSPLNPSLSPLVHLGRTLPPPSIKEQSE